MATTYFGKNDNGDGNDVSYGYSWWTNAGYVCPGTGAQNVITLDVNIADVASGNVRLAIFDASKNFVMQWDNQYAPGGTGWMAKTSFADQGGSPIANPQLTGGTTYLLVMTDDGTVKFYFQTGSTSSIIGTDYTAGFPASLSGESPHTLELAIRCGVEPAAGGEIHELVGSADSVSLLSDPNDLDKIITGSSDSISLLSGAIAVDRTVNGSADSITLLTGSISINRSISGSTDSITLLSGNIILDKSLIGSSYSVTLLSGAINRSVIITGNADSVSLLSGQLSIALELAGGVSSVTLLAGILEGLGYDEILTGDVIISEYLTSPVVLTETQEQDAIITEAVTGKGVI